jgi:hypothetical protein
MRKGKDPESGSIPLSNGSGWPKNMRTRIHNTGIECTISIAKSH